ncbi:MAG: pyridoxamine 5'-phosphate oxidase family protein [candidate division WOR-3 bacterium]|nr:pyridoxamine 5'-phosphate oxidase family protein [candidate division WOR-3 bacterium]
MDEKEIKRASIELLESADAAYVTTIDKEGYPQTRCMFNLRNKTKFPKLVHMFKDHRDDLMILFSTNTSSEKIAQIKDNSAVCVYYCAPNDFHGLMLAGNIEILDDPHLREALWQEGWKRYYPEGPHDPDHTVLRLYPKKTKGWYKGQAFGFKILETT